jgi:hypothetical protein
VRYCAGILPCSNRPRQATKKSGMRVRIAIALCLAATAAGCGKANTPTTEAQSYVKAHEAEARYVSQNIRFLRSFVTHAEPELLYEAEVLAARAHDRLAELRRRFGGSGIEGALEAGLKYRDAQLRRAAIAVGEGLKSLRNAMGAAVAYYHTPAPDTQSAFRSQLARGKSQWNSGVNKIWQLAHKPRPPTV